MADLIDRRAAIEAVNNAFDRETLLTGFVRSIAVRVIRDMPSTQPEVIRCKDCKFSHMTNDGRYCKYCDQFTDTDDYGELVEMYFDSDFYCGYAERRTDG